jgi:hypothetical protein
MPPATIWHAIRAQARRAHAQVGASVRLAEWT